MAVWEFDPAKDATNLAKHGISLSRAGELAQSEVEIDPRHAEERYRTFGFIDGLLYCLIFTIRGRRYRAISLRRCHLEEFNDYVARRNR